jgi:hypothetical protein
MTDNNTSDPAITIAVDNNASPVQASKKAGETAKLKAKSPSKSDSVRKLLGRAKGASISEIIAVTSWQTHSARAFLTGLRKKDIAILGESRKDGETAYRIAH